MSDISRIAEILIFGKRVAYRSIFQNDMVSFHDLQVLDLANTYIDHPETINDMLVYDDGIIKGMINRTEVGDKLEIKEFYVEPFFKGKGIGNQLISYVIEEAKQKKLSCVYLWVIGENMDARRFYEHHNLWPNGKTEIIEGTDKLLLCYELML